MVVLFPAPLGPRKPKISPLRTVRPSSLTAHRRPNRLPRLWVCRTGSFSMLESIHGNGQNSKLGAHSAN